MTLRLVRLTIAAANAFVADYHRHNDPVVGAIFAIGASDGTDLWGVALVGRPVGRKLDDGETAELTRCCAKGGAPKGTCSFLYQRAWRAWQALGGRRMVTYTLATESGSSLKGLRDAGWKMIGESPAHKEGGGWQTRKDRRWQPETVGSLKLRWVVTAA